MKWEKLGQIWKTKPGGDWRLSHAMLPTVDHIDDDVYRIYYSGRDFENRSVIGYFNIRLDEKLSVIDICKSPVLEPGQLGCFDDNGVTPSCIVTTGGKKRLYYIGWKPRSTTRMGLTPGIAHSNDGGLTFQRESRAPILIPTDAEPFQILTAPFVINTGQKWYMWYVSGVEWIHADLPRYNLKMAFSDDGLKWEQTGHVAINFKNQNENALGRPCVIKDGDGFRMWYSYKGGDTPYRIGYAESNDGLNWERLDHKAGIDTSEDGWDSEMIEYTYVIRHKGRLYMFYNGNEYGQTGIGLAAEG